jgi:hypothetical protein
MLSAIKPMTNEKLTALFILKLHAENYKSSGHYNKSNDKFNLILNMFINKKGFSYKWGANKVKLIINDIPVNDKSREYLTSLHDALKYMHRRNKFKE